MASAQWAARWLPKLESRDWAVLYALEKSLSSYENVPVDFLVKASGLNEEEVKFRLSRLHDANLVFSRLDRYSLVVAALDAIALHALYKKGHVTGLGQQLAMGKESDVYEAISDTGDLYAVKFYRIGRTSFRATRKKRGYVPPMHQRQWLTICIGAARSEEDALKKLMVHGASVPHLVARERHAVLMRKIEGRILVNWLELDEPKKVLLDILDNIRKAYVDGGVVNGDLSEFNILYDGSRVWIIDWPQAVGKDHPNASLLLDRDVRNIVNYFRRKHHLNCTLESSSFYVRGWRDTLDFL